MVSISFTKTSIDNKNVKKKKHLIHILFQPQESYNLQSIYKVHSSNQDRCLDTDIKFALSDLMMHEMLSPQISSFFLLLKLI